MGSKPRQVVIALALLLCATAAYLAVSLLRLSAAPVGALLFLAPAMVLGLVVPLALVDQIARRHDWARITVVVGAGLWLLGGLPADVENALDGTWQGTVSLIPLSLSAILGAVGSVFLLVPEAVAWFRVAPPVRIEGIAAADGEWFYSAGADVRGPVSEPDLRDMLRSGQLEPESLAWTPGMAEWQQATIALGQHAPLASLSSSGKCNGRPS